MLVLKITVSKTKVLVTAGNFAFVGWFYLVNSQYSPFNFSKYSVVTFTLVVLVISTNSILKLEKSVVFNVVLYVYCRRQTLCGSQSIVGGKASFDLNSFFRKKFQSHILPI